LCRCKFCVTPAVDVWVIKMDWLKKQASKTSLSKKKSYNEKTLLHGHLEIDVKQARNLPDMESWVAKLYDSKDVSDPFVDIRLGKAKLAKTSIIFNDLNPKWDESYKIEVCHFADELIFEIRDKDHAYTELIGSVVIPTSRLVSGQVFDQEFDILSKGTSGKKHGTLELMVHYVSKLSQNHTYDVDCYFQMHQNSNVILYQDAHAKPPGENGHKQFYTMPPELNYYPRSCWTDLYHTIMQAKQLICITGWSVWHELKLFRGADQATYTDKNLGEILKEKADEGVHVFVMVWSEKTSNQLKTEGVMGTHDMSTYNYFKNNTKVRCALAPREHEDLKELTDVINDQFSSGAYTHHQKSVIADAPGAYDDRRRLTAFVGGLDLTGGRYDTPDFELFSTLLDEHNGDFRNSNAKSVPPEQGPREPWHDIHCRVEGPIVADVLNNFIERWSKQGTKEIRHLDFKNEYCQGIDLYAPAPVADPAKVWNCQLFRSITVDSANFMEASRMSHLNSKKGRMVDSSIAQAYIQLIRGAQNFIYIENQYFLGSAYSWHQNDDTNCNHTIPAEIAQKVVEKIRNGERFTAYIVIPMFPEGHPESMPIQEILYWQYRTMEMMYDMVGNALRESQHHPICQQANHPTDWLLFLCPGKREAGGPHLDALETATEPMAQIFRKTLRFPIYVHSKMIIVDDSYILVGSANINQRSMAGTRDTEMAIGSHQPSYPPHHPYGDVHAFRMSLFAQWFKKGDPAFIHPGTIDCVQKVKEFAWLNWQAYISDKPQVTEGQILPYPLNVMEDGRLEYLEPIGSWQGKTFPDFRSGSNIKGTLSTLIPQKVTT